MKKLIVLLIVFSFFSYEGYSRAQYSILQAFGMKCQNCHFNVQGGGVRNNAGWGSRKDIALYNPSWLSKGYDKVIPSNTFINDIFNVGLDFRYQNAKWPGSPTITGKTDDGGTIKTIKTERESMVMQLSPYLVATPLKWLSFEGFYNLAYEIEKTKRYPGQKAGAWSLNFRPSESLPYLRVGNFQPTLGTKYDDHTLLIHRIAAGTQYARPIKPDDYAEWGAQLDYESISWLGLSLGAFQSKSLGTYTVADFAGKNHPLVNTDRASMVARVAFYPNIGKGFNTFFGGMMLYNGPMGKSTDINDTYFSFSDLFFHIGLGDKFAIMTEYVSTHKHFMRTTDNFLVEFDYLLMDALNVFVRAERATTSTRKYDENRDYQRPIVATNQFVFGAHIFPLPYIDILPEYRIYRSEELQGAQQSFAIQLHVFY